MYLFSLYYFDFFFSIHKIIGKLGILTCSAIFFFQIHKMDYLNGGIATQFVALNGQPRCIHAFWNFMQNIYMSQRQTWYWRRWSAVFSLLLQLNQFLYGDFHIKKNVYAILPCKILNMSLLQNSHFVCL
jgi:hypothetical protein